MFQRFGKKVIVAVLLGAGLILSLGKATTSPTDTITITVTIDTGSPKADIYRPEDGDKVSGDAVIIKSSSEDTDIKEVRYQYRSSNPGDWTNIDIGTDKNSNFRVLWDTTGLSNGKYDLRAIAKDQADNEDTSLSTISVTIDHHIPDYTEDEIEKNQDTTIEREDGIKVMVPQGTLREGDILRISKPDPSELPQPEDNPTGLYIKIELESKKTQLNKPVAVSIPYPDVDNNGIVDGTNIPEENLKINIWNETNSIWEELPTTVDPVNNITTATAVHFSIFGVFGSFAPDLDDVLIYPNPFRPDDDITIKFLNLTGNVIIRIYNVAGELVRIEEEISTGAWEWDGKNDSGEPVATGGYIYIITDSEGRKRSGKIAVIW